MRYSSGFGYQLFMLTLLMVSFTPGISAQIINEDVKLLPADGTSGDAFGQSSAIHNGVVVIGASSDDDNGINSGSAYIMHLILDVAPVKLLALDGAANDLFGHDVAIGTVPIGISTQTFTLVGAPNDSDQGTNSGSAYLFSLNGNQHVKYLPNDGALGDNFGVSVAIDNGIVVVGAPEDDDLGVDSGSAYIFDANTGLQLAKLLPSNGVANDTFGYQVAISGDIIAVSALQHLNPGGETGTVYLFSASKATEFAQLSSNEGVPFEQFGYSLAIDNGIVAVGSLATGSAYIFNASTQALINKLTPSTPGNAFGWTIDIDASKVVVGAILDPVNGQNSGSAFLFNAFTGTQLAKLIPSDGAIFEQFGSSIGIDNDLIIVGARNDNDNGGGSGSAYVFDIFCPADLNGDGMLNFFDVSAFLSAFAAQNPIADFNNDGLFNFFDVSAFLAAFAQGCP